VEATAHNIANVSTAGFKRQLGVTPPFATMLNATANAEAVTTDSSAKAAPIRPFGTHVDMRQGALSQTQNPLHFALSGPGFMVVRRGDQTHYTRAGAFERSADGKVVNADGAVLQVNGGDLVVSSANVSVAADGTVVDGQRPVGRIAVVTIDSAALTDRAAGSGFLVDASAVAPAEDAVVKQGFLEMANVDLGQEMVQMMELMRRFELGQKLAQAHEEMMERSIRRLGDLQS
jgi:flagellar basal-body rod protein FlgF